MTEFNAEMNLESSSKSNKFENFYFFVENEFMFYNDCDLIANGTGNEYFVGYAMTINLTRLSKFGRTFYKIYKEFSRSSRDKNDMEEIYRRAQKYIQDNFIINDGNSKFIGCVRDDNSTHEYCVEGILNFPCRSDPTHDIFNIMKNIYLDEPLQLQNYDNHAGHLIICYSDLRKFLYEFENDGSPEIPIVRVGWQSNFPDPSRSILISGTNTKLEQFILPFQRLFIINYFEKINEMLDFVQNPERKGKKEKAKSLVNFILLLKKILKFQEKLFYCEQNIESYKNFFLELSKYNFSMNSNLRCLNSLKTSMETNLVTFSELVENGIKFKPEIFSTQIIEAEKGHLKYNNCGNMPSLSQCERWFENGINGDFDEDLTISSEFGQVEVQFSKLPGHVAPMLPIDNYSI